MFLQRFLSWRPYGDGRVWLIAAFVGIFYVLEIAPNWTTFRYKMTVEIETPEGMKTGSSVVEYVRRPMINIPGIVEMMFCFCTRHGSLLRSIHGTKGLAVIFDLGSQGWVVVPPIGSPSEVYKPNYRDFTPNDLGSHLPRIQLPDVYRQPIFLIPASGNIAAAHFLRANELEDLAEGLSIKSVAMEPTSERLLTRVAEPAPEWIVRLREKRALQIPDWKRGRTSLMIGYIEKGWW